MSFYKNRKRWKRGLDRMDAIIIAALLIIVTVGSLAAIFDLVLNNPANSNTPTVSTSTLTGQNSTLSVLGGTSSSANISLSTIITTYQNYIYVVEPKTVLNLATQECETYAFATISQNMSLQGNFNANVSVAAYVFNSTGYSQFQSQGVNATDYMLSTGLPSHLHLVSIGNVDLIFPSIARYYLSFCNWSTNSTVVSVGSSGIILLE
ncbi:MAG: hypothetical protein ACYC7D_13825 [Nitrososphaerales archaeon]